MIRDSMWFTNCIQEIVIIEPHSIVLPLCTIQLTMLFFTYFYRTVFVRLSFRASSALGVDAPTRDAGMDAPTRGADTDLS